MTPCFTTIQAGVNNAGPGPSAVFVFPGVYNESVDIGLMGSAIAASAGPLMLRAVDSTGMQTTGGVSVFPPTGAALRNSLVPFPGDVFIDGFTVKSPDDDGIALGSVAGNILLFDIVSNGNAGEGFTGSTTLVVSTANSSFSDNLGGNGLTFTAPNGVSFDKVTADRNSGGGASFSVTMAVVSATRSSFSRNKNGAGLSFGTAVGVQLDHVTADENQNTGATFAVNGPVIVGHSSFSGAINGGGLSFGTATTVTFEEVTADNNQNDGASFAVTGAVDIKKSTFRGAKNGGGLTFGTATDVSLTDVMADANKNTGASFAMTGALTIIRSSFNDAGNGGGLSFAAPTRVTFNQVIADRNTNDGATFLAAGPVDISNSIFTNARNGDGLVIGGATRVVLLNVTANDNSGDGFSAVLQSAKITGSHFLANGRNGVLLTPTQGGDDFQLSCNDIAGNLTGLRLTAAAVVHAANNFWGSESGPTHPSNPGGTGDPIADGANGGAGTVIFKPFLTEETFRSAFCQARGAPALGGPGLALVVLMFLFLARWRFTHRDDVRWL
jgi:hypothetical protein